VTNGWVALATIVGGIIASAGGGEIIKAALRKLRQRGTPVERVRTLTESTLEWAESLKSEAAAARKDARAARAETAQVRREVATIRVDLEYLESLVSRITQLIHHEPGMTIERLRLLVPEGPPRRRQGGRPS